jgi:hypothetical protein
VTAVATPFSRSKPGARRNHAARAPAGLIVAA